MNELYEFMKQVDVIVLFCLIYGLAINGITKRKEKKVVQKDDVTE